MFADDLDRLAALHADGKLNDDEFARAKSRVLGDDTASRAPAGGFGPALNRLRRSRDERWIGGVCGGIARATGVEAWIWRIVFTLLLLTGPCSLAAYLLLWIFVPSE